MIEDFACAWAQAPQMPRYTMSLLIPQYPMGMISIADITDAPVFLWPHSEDTRVQWTCPRLLTASHFNSACLSASMPEWFFFSVGAPSFHKSGSPIMPGSCSLQGHLVIDVGGTGVCWAHTLAAPSFGNGTVFWCIIHEKVLKGSLVGEKLIAHHGDQLISWGCSPFLSHFSPSITCFSYNYLQLQHLHPSPSLTICFWEIPKAVKK